MANCMDSHSIMGIYFKINRIKTTKLKTTTPN